MPAGSVGHPGKQGLPFRERGTDISRTRGDEPYAVSLRRVAMVAGLDHGNMHQCIRREAPELTEDESDAITIVLRDAGIMYIRNHTVIIP